VAPTHQETRDAPISKAFDMPARTQGRDKTPLSIDAAG
jgi:hypothetical protein